MWDARTYNGNANIAQLLREIVGSPKHGEYGTWVCTVKDIDTESRTCTCIKAYGNGEEIIKVRLQAARNSENGQVIIPITGSYVIVSRSDDGVAFIVATTEIDQILTTANLVEFNGGENGGLINIEGLVDRINRCETAINTIHNAIVGNTPTTGDGGAAYQAQVLGKLGLTPDITPLTQRGDFEDDKITH